MVRVAFFCKIALACSLTVARTGGRIKTENELVSGPAAANPLEDLGRLGGQSGRQIGFELELRGTEHLEALRNLVPQELARVLKGLKGRFLFLFRTLESQADVRVAMVRRKIHLAHSDTADARIRQLIADQLLQLFADAL